MKKSNQIVFEDAMEFIKNLFRVYLEDRNFALLLSMFHKDISWFGTGSHEVCKNYDDAVSLMKAEMDSWDGHFKIIEQWYQAIPINAEFCIIFGELKIVEDGLNTVFLDMDFRFSTVCTIDDGSMKLYHAHFSTPDIAQTQDEFVHKSLVSDYNILLEEKLQERTKMLKDKTKELETITNNIEVSIVQCNYTNNFIVSFANDGLFRMIGYTREQFEAECGNSLKSLMHPDDAESVNESLGKQLESGNTTSNINKLIRRDGTIIWVLIKGIAMTNDSEELEFNGAIIDVTEQHEQEYALKISEKRYEIAMKISHVTMFEYNLVTKQLILLDDNDAEMYGVSNIVENGVETFIKKGIVEPNSVESYRGIYRQICAGEPFAQAYVNARDVDGIIHQYEISLTNVFDNSGTPIRAIGVRRNMTQMHQLQRENEFGKTMVLNKDFIFEADITTGQLLFVNDDIENRTGITVSILFDEAIKQISKTMVAPEHRDMFMQKLSKENITQTFENGERLIVFSYRKKNDNNECYWFKATVNIIKEQITDNINIRYYTTDINDQKKKEQKNLEEQRLYETIVTKAMMAYEVNITKQIIISGHENWDKLFGIEKSNDYSKLIKLFSKKIIHVDDRAYFIKIFSRDNVLRKFREGEREFTYQYRIIRRTGEFVWVSCNLHIYEDSETNDIKGYAYVENIDKHKKVELALQYEAEHDALTGFYNKSTTEKLITNCIGIDGTRGIGKHAFIMIDIDYFKSINDNFGHVFGDAVLSQISAKINTLFREDDIIGRIGGDEFAVFMKNIYSDKIVISKAKEICTELLETYYRHGKSYKISASVGIAMYNQHGESYVELYKHSDSALYSSKKNGRNQFTIYDNDMESVEFEEFARC